MGIRITIRIRKRIRIRIRIGIGIRIRMGIGIRIWIRLRLRIRTRLSFVNGFVSLGDCAPRQKRLRTNQKPRSMSRIRILSEATVRMSEFGRQGVLDSKYYHY